ncbi:MAG: hypothetical protein KKH52_02775 [Nanoarchaeota archaeon]|nr:hypothetical protein [Nanoarchaeota archaeon]MBU1622614.1 hypothetical protein [Nanoarchaeota archaeon]MBU1974296.1 hypothetical protein [Nanoarchaeota archaeon]
MKSIRKPKQRNYGKSKIKIKDKNITFRKSSLVLDASKINFSHKDKKKCIILPSKLTPLLAEEMGMHLGDGFLSASKYDYRLKGHKLDEKWYYVDYIRHMYKQLYNIDVKLKNYSDTIGFEIYSKALWEFKVCVLGINPGRKDDICLPEIIKVNDEDILRRFIRGFFDTDGSVYFMDTNGTGNFYPRLSITQKSKQIIDDLGNIFRMLGFSPKVYHYKTESHVILYGYSQLKHYENEIGWSSPKHLKKVRRWKEMFTVAMV